MLTDALIFASCSFGSAVFGLLVGLAAAGSTRRGGATFPPTHVSFEPLMSDEDRLRFLEEAQQAILTGRLRPSTLKLDKESREAYYQQILKTGLAPGESHSTSSRNSRGRK